ncbi:MAG: hypothetical protein C0412_16840, partial [Flavobacterium sp.]|nr:hypothetical protein [Flavobacterium sp.]
MKIIFCVIVFSLFNYTFIFAQNEGVFSIKPEKPILGKEIIVTYNAGFAGAKLKDATEIILYAKLVQNNGMSSLVEAKMEKKGNIWTGSFKLNDTMAKVILFRFDSGDITDDNNGNCWSSFIYNPKGEAVEYAHNTMSMLYLYKGLNGFPVPENRGKSDKEIELETKLYPSQQNDDVPLTKFYKAYVENSGKKEAAEQAVNDILKYYRENEKKEDIFINVTSTLRKIKEFEKADEVTAEYLKEFPNGKYALQEKINNIYRENNKANRIELVQKFFQENPDLSKDIKEQIQYVFVQALIALNKYDEAYSYISKMEVQNGAMYNALSWTMLEKGENLEKALTWAKKGIDLLRNPNVLTRPANVTLKDWKNSLTVTLADILDTYAYGLDKLGRYEEAEKAFEEVFSIIKAPLGADYYTRYIECLNKNKKYEKAVEFAEQCIKKGITSDKLNEAYKEAFLKIKGTAEEFKKKGKELNDEGSKQKKENLTGQLLNKPAPKLSLKSLDGKTVNLADLKGKVVVVDFWATWCGPCKASFPALQKVYEKYLQNKNVVILAVNTWEYEKGNTREKIVKKFISDNKYNFPVLLDHEDKTEGFVTQFEVANIPTKFI